MGIMPSNKTCTFNKRKSKGPGERNGKSSPCADNYHMLQLRRKRASLCDVG